MLKKLFGRKKENKPVTLADAKYELLESIREESLNKHVGKNFNQCLELIGDDNSEYASLAESVYELIHSLPVSQGSLALSICANLVERGYRDESLIDKVVELFSKSLKESRPFFDLLDNKVKAGEEGDSEIDVDVDSLYYELLKDNDLVSKNIGESVLKVEYFSQYLIAILSIDPSYISKYKVKLKDDINFIRDYIQGSYWLDRLFNVFFDEAILVIDVDNHIGFEGRMSGVSDNYQLQHLLMGVEELNDQLEISEQDLSVASGTGVHISNSIIESKWNMYNYEICEQEDWEEIKIGPAKTHDLQDFWIWGEGTPSEISVHEGRRVILLGRSSYKRTTRLQRSFKNMRASVDVEKVLSDEEITSFLGLKKTK